MPAPLLCLFLFCRFGLFFCPFLDTFGQQIFDLSVDRSKIVLSPCRQRLIELGRKAKRDLLLFHTLIQAARVDNGLGVAIAAKHHQKIGHHSRLAFLVKRDSAVFTESL